MSDNIPKTKIIFPGINSFLSDDIESKILSPLYCIRDLGSQLVLEFDLPLVNKKDIQISFNDNVISIEAKLREKYLDAKLGQVNEFLYFKKSLGLPSNIISKNISAQFEKGRLTIVIPKKKSGQKIKIK